MNKLPLIALLAAMCVAVMSCNSDDDTWEDYKEWRENNESWLIKQKALRDDDGSLYYTEVRPSYDLGTSILMHWFNDPSETAGNLMPYYTSTVAVKYIGHLYDDVAFDSSYLQTDSIVNFKVSGVIAGWQIALQNMHVGDSVEVVIPYAAAYGTTGSGSIPPFSNLRFNMKLVDIPKWEIK